MLYSRFVLERSLRARSLRNLKLGKWLLHVSTSTPMNGHKLERLQTSRKIQFTLIGIQVHEWPQVEEVTNIKEDTVHIHWYTGTHGRQVQDGMVLDRATLPFL